MENPTRYLLCSLDTPGFIYPMIGLAKHLQQRGHEVAIATSPMGRELLDQQNIPRIPFGPEDGRSFETKLLTHPHETARQVKHLHYALREFDPQVIVGQQLVLGPLLVAEWYQLPVAIVGQAVYMYPKKTLSIHQSPESPEEQRAVHTHTSILAAYNAARSLFGRPAREVEQYHDSPLLGDLFLLRNVPDFEGESELLPDRVQQIGDWLWEPKQRVEPALQRWLEEALACQEPILYVQPGRIHEGRSFWPALCDALADKPIRVVASVGRLGEEMGSLPANFFARPHIPQGAVLPYTRLVISSSTTTAVLGALTHGVPMMLIVSRDGEQQPILDRCQRHGVACELDLFHLSPVLISQAVQGLLDDQPMYQRSQKLQSAFQAQREPEAAIACLEQLAPHKTG
ncbi:MAG: glycosyltransferase [Ardenticatenales bacterium]|nr:glycosyltransferase [Ardenticatenales bacterium]